MSNTTKIKGILTDVFPVETRPSFSKRVIWIKEPDTERYPQHWEVELHGADIRAAEKLKIGDSIEMEVEVRGRQYKRRDGSKAIFLTLKANSLELKDRLNTTNTGYKAKPGSHDDKVESRKDPELPLSS